MGEHLLPLLRANAKNGRLEREQRPEETRRVAPPGAEPFHGRRSGLAEQFADETHPAKEDGMPDPLARFGRGGPGFCSQRRVLAPRDSDRIEGHRLGLQNGPDGGLVGISGRSARRGCSHHTDQLGNVIAASERGHRECGL